MSRSLVLAKRITVSSGPVHLPRPLVTHDSVYVGDADHELLRLDRSTLETVWRQPADGLSVRAEFAGLIVLFRGAKLYQAIDPRTGNALWRVTSEEGAILYSWRDRLLLIEDGHVRFMDPVSGSMLGDPIRLPYLPLLQTHICGDVLLLASLGGGRIVAYDLVHHQLLWRKHLLGDVRASHGFAAEQVVQFFDDGRDGFIVQTPDATFGCTLAEGTIRWAVSTPTGRACARDDRMWVITPGLNNEPVRFVCVNIQTGQIVYDRQPGLQPVFDPLPAALGEHVAAYGSPRSTVVTLRLSDGTLAGSYKYKCSVSGPAFAGERLLVPASDGMLLAFEGWD